MMYLDVAKYIDDVGEVGLKLPFYRIIGETEEQYEAFFDFLRKKHIYECTMLSVEVKDCVIDYAKSKLKFPALGISMHISDLLSGKSALCKVLSSQRFNLKEENNV